MCLYFKEKWHLPFVTTVKQDVARANVRLLDLQARAAQGSAKTKAQMDLQMASLQRDLKATESKLAYMQRAGGTHWREFESELNAATARLRKWLDTSTR